MKVAKDFSRFLRIEGAPKLIVIMFSYGIGMGILTPMNAVYLKQHVGLSKTEIAAVFAISLLLNMIITLGAGWVSDKFHSRKALPVCAAFVCMLGLIMYMRAGDFASALYSMALVTAPSGLIMGQLFGMARNHFNAKAEEIVEMAQIWLRATYSVGFFSGLLLGANLFLIATFQGVLWGNFAGYLLLFGLLLTYKEIKSAPSFKLKQAGEPFSLIMLTALLMIARADAIRGLYLPLVVNELFVKPQLMSWIWSVQAVFELLFMTLSGYGAIKYGSKIMIMFGSMFALVSYAVYAFSESLWLFFLVQPLYSLFVSILYGVGMGYVQRMFLSRTGFGASLYVFIMQSASLLGYILPLSVSGFNPHIFLIAFALIVLALFMIALVLLRESVKTGNNKAAGV